MSANLSKYILTTLAYYDALDYPMTAFEIWKCLTRAEDEKTEEKFDLADVLHDYGMGTNHDWEKSDDGVIDKVLGRAVEILIKNEKEQTK